MSFVVTEFFLTGVAQPLVPQQPILNKGIPVKSKPTTTSIASRAIIACTVIAIPASRRINRIKFQLYNQRLFALAKNIFTITDINPNDFSLKSMKVNNVGNVVGVVGRKSNLNNSDYDFDKIVIFTYNINTKTE